MPALQGLAVAMPLSAPLRLGLAPHAASGLRLSAPTKANKKPREATRGVFFFQTLCPQGILRVRRVLQPIMASSLWVSTTKARMPSASFSVAMASSFRAKRKLASSWVTNGMSIAWAACGVQRLGQRRLVGGQLGQEIGADGQQVATGQRRDLAHVAEARAHHLGGDAVLLVEVVDGAHRLHTRVVGTGHGGLVPGGAGVLLVPVVDAAHKGRNQLHLGLAAGHGLGKRKQQGQVAVDAFALQLSRGLNTFPGRGHLDQHAVFAHALGGEELDDATGAGHGGFGIEAQTRVHFGRNAAGNVFQDLAAKTHQQTVHDLVFALCAVFRHGVGQQRRVFGLLHGFQDQRRVGRGVLRRVCSELVEIARIGNNGGESFECV